MPLLEEYIRKHLSTLEDALDESDDDIKIALAEAYSLGAVSEQTRLGATDLSDDDLVALERHLAGKHDQRLHGRKSASPGPIYTAEQYHEAATIAMENSAKFEPAITADITTIAKAVGGTPEGLDFRRKTNVPRTEEKLGEYVKMRIKDGRPTDNLNEVAKADLKDLVRYTFTAQEANLAAVTQHTFASLEARGYERVAVKNYFGKSGPGGYKGINTNMKSPTGQIFELQFHTPATFDIKEGRGGGHRIYEVLRDSKASRVARAVANRQSLALWSNAQTPSNINAIGSFP